MVESEYQTSSLHRSTFKGKDQKRFHIETELGTGPKREHQNYFLPECQKF